MTSSLLRTTPFRDIYSSYTFAEVTFQLGISCSPLSVTSLWYSNVTHTLSEVGLKCRVWWSRLSTTSLWTKFTTEIFYEISIVLLKGSFCKNYTIYVFCQIVDK